MPAEDVKIAFKALLPERKRAFYTLWQKLSASLVCQKVYRLFRADGKV